MRIVIVGPTHPFKGGIAQHTSELARQLSGAGHEVAVISWKSQYPTRLYPGELVVPDGAQEVPLAVPVHRIMDWYDPSSWWQAGTRAQAADLVVVAHSNPFQIPAYRSLLTSASRVARTPTRVLIAHNVTPHESSRWQKRAIDSFRGVIDVVLVHSDDERIDAQEHFPSADIRCVPLAPHGPAMTASTTTVEAKTVRNADDQIDLLAFGFIRAYKGLPLLLDAVASAPQIRVTIRGECWDDDLDAQLRQMVDRPTLQGRVDYRSGYVPASEIDRLFATHDAAVLPYLEATGSQNTSLAQAYGLPVIVSDVPALTVGVLNDVNGLVVPAGDTEAWCASLAGLTRADIDRWASQVAAVDSVDAWATYIEAVTRSVESSSTKPTTLLAQSQGVRQAHVISDPVSRVAKAEAIATVISRVAVLEGATILDDGCGSGYIAQELARLVGPSGKVIGVDRVDERQISDGFEFLLLEDNELALEDSCVDVVVSNHVLEHVGERDQQAEYLREIHRVLKPGGWVYLAIPNKYRLMEAHYGLPLLSWLPQSLADRFVRVTGKGEWYDVDPLSRSSLRAALMSAGLKPTDVTGDIARRELAKLPGGPTLSSLPAKLLEPALQIVPTFVVLAQKP